MVYLSPALNLYMQNDKSPVREDEDVNIESMIMKTELAYTSSALPFTVIRNQYVYGGDQSPFLEYIINRLVRDVCTITPTRRAIIKSNSCE